MNDKQQLAALIQAAIEAGTTKNAVLINLTAAQINAMLEHLPETWMPKPETKPADAPHAS